MKTKDHVVPKSKGGTRTVEACLRCNAAKRDMSLEEFRRLRGGIEFWGEMRARLANTETAWMVEDVYAPAAKKRTLLPVPTTRPIYEATVDLNKIKQYSNGARTKQERKKSTPTSPPDLVGVKFGCFTVLRRLTGKWEVICICGAIEHRTSRAVLNPCNTFDACVDCRRPVGKLRSDIFKETGVEVSWEDCFQHIYGAREERCELAEKSMRLELTAEQEEMWS